jgi:hypothetical protein
MRGVKKISLLGLTLDWQTLMEITLAAQTLLTPTL